MILNITLLEALEKMRGYARFLNQLVKNKRVASFEDIGGLNHCNAVTLKSLDQNKNDLGAFMIPYTIRISRFSRALCDLRSNIN